MRYFLLLLLLLIFLPTNIVLACSGPTPTFDGILEGASTIVRARVVSSDEREENAIIQVETYFKGSGNEYLSLLGNTRGTTNGLIDMRYGMGDCTSRYPYLLEEESYYLILQPYIAGTFRLRSRFYFPEADSTVEVYLNDEYVRITEAEFLDLLSEYSHAQTAPIHNERPIPTPLRITTESGMNYLLPVDGSAPVPLTADLYLTVHNNRMAFFLEDDFRELCGENLDCFHFSPSLFHIVVQASPDEIVLDNGISFQGQSFLFSPRGHSLAIWNGTSIEVYDLYSRRLLDEWLAHLSNENELLSAEYAAWSPDGRLLAYSDSEGLWLWDVFTENTAPRLLIAAEENTPFAKNFSPLGRYLAVQIGAEASYLDLISGQSFPDGLFSPDERFLLAYDRNESPSTAEFCTLVPFECEQLEAPTTGVFWLNNHGFYAMWCEPMETSSCDLYYEEASFVRAYGYPQDPENPDYIPVRLFAYEPENDLLATVRGDYQLNERDLSAYLDSPIAKIEWLPSFFYHEN